MAAQFMAGAAQFVGGAFLSSSIQGLCDRMYNCVVSGEVLEFIRGGTINEKQLQNLLEKLMITMNSVNTVLDDAEEKQITDRRVKNWLDELRDVVYEAEDLLDLIHYGALKFQFECTDQVRNSSSSYSFTALEDVSEENVNRLIEKFEYLGKQKGLLPLRECTGFGEKAFSFSQRVPTVSLVDESGVYGRHNDKEFVMRLLFDDSHGHVPGVIPIVGLGGVGKTTLAQLVYNDLKVQEWFELKSWVCVSDKFDVFKVIKEILKQVSKVDCDKLTPNDLQIELKKALLGEKFLIVLDDIWNESYNHWDFLRVPLATGAEGSRVIITTRNESVASVMRTFPSYHIEELNDDDCWSVFAKHAFFNENSSAYPRLEAIGREIIRKVKGLPLAAKTLGGLLRCERDARKWEKVLRSNLWNLQNNEILPALELSYHYLPSHLKRCFAYCAIFPKDYGFRKNELVLLWMAEGLSDGSESVEDMKHVGEDHFDNLVSRSFLQQSSSRSCFFMHDLIHDLATFVSGEFCCRLEDSSRVSRKARHLSCVRLSTIEGMPLRTIMCTDMEKEDVNLLPTFRCLRVLSLARCYKIFVLPRSIGNLIHLRYLDLTASSVTTLPDSVTSLYNLQSLILYHCSSLLELPRDLASLINLCCLDIRYTCLWYMPPNLGRLEKLQQLSNFIVECEHCEKYARNHEYADSGREAGSSIRELGKLQRLKGKLVIRRLGCIVDALEASEANLKGKEHLTELELLWGYHSADLQHHEQVLESLQPHTSLECLSIYGYRGETFPLWVGDSSFSNLVSLKLSNCKCKYLPPLGELESLKVLSISYCDNVKFIGPEFYGSCTHPPFPSLEILRFDHMQSWQDWKGKTKAFPVLQILYILHCPKLMMAPLSHTPSLTVFRYEDCPQLALQFPTAPIFGMKLNGEATCPLKVKLHSCSYFSIHEVPPVMNLFEGTEQVASYSATIEEFELENCDELLYFPADRFPCLKKLYIRLCPSFKSLSSHIELTSLTSLEINRCCNFVSFPAGGLCAPNLTELRIVQCLNLKLLPEHMQSLLTSLKHLRIEGCPELESFPKNGLPSKLESLAIVICNKLGLISVGDNGIEDAQTLQFPSTLTYLRISSLPKQKSIDFKRLQHLKEMTISNCRNLLSLSENMPFLFPSLVKLSMVSCSSLENSFLQGGLPSKLESLEIRSCKNVITGLMQYDLRMLPSLTNFTIAGSDDLESLPEQTLLPSSLVSLLIRDLKNLKSVGLQHLTSLKSLEIYNCNNLQSRDEEWLPSSLAYCRIKGCPLLCEVYKRDIGYDLPENTRRMKSF